MYVCMYVCMCVYIYIYIYIAASRRRQFILGGFNVGYFSHVLLFCLGVEFLTGT